MPKRILCFPQIIFPLLFSKVISNIFWVLEHELPSPVQSHCFQHSQLSLIAWLQAIFLVNCLPNTSCMNRHASWPLYLTPPSFLDPGEAGVTWTDIRNALCPSWEECGPLLVHYSTGDPEWLGIQRTLAESWGWPGLLFTLFYLCNICLQKPVLMESPKLLLVLPPVILPKHCLLKSLQGFPNAYDRQRPS